ncbi:MAG: PAS domain S-box protein [Methylococcaceae bacterium]
MTWREGTLIKNNPNTPLNTTLSQSTLSKSLKTMASFTGALLLVILVSVESFWAFKTIEQAALARLQTLVIINQANDLLSALRDAETGQRGYCLTGDNTFLQPYLAVRGNVATYIAALRSLSLSNPALKHVDNLEPLVGAKLAEMAQTIELRRNNETKAMLAMISNGQGKQLMDAIRAEINALIQLENSALTQHEAEFQANMRHLFIIIVTSSVILLLLTIAFVLLNNRQARQRLKDLVHSETAHLLEIQQETNKQLQQTNTVLQVSEEKLAVTLNSIGDAVIATDAKGLVILLNPPAEKLTGWTQAQAWYQSVDDIFHIINQETREPCVVPIKTTLANGTIQGLANHTVLIAKDGNECAIADSCAPIRDRDGLVIGAVLVFRDVTDEYAAQQALRDSAARIQTILNAVVDGIITFHANSGIIETINAAAERMFGFMASELVAQNVSLLIPELSQDPCLLDCVSSNEQSRANVGRERIGRRKDGSYFPLEIAVNEMSLGGQRYFTAIVRDITRRKGEEEALIKVGALQSAIFNSANFSSIATDAKGVIQIFNVGAECMLGYTAADVMNKITPADISDSLEVIARAKALSMELGTPITPGFEALVFKASRGIEDIYELTYIRKDGSRFPAVVSVTALRDDEDGIIGYLLIGTDNTARKQIEAEQKLLAQRLRDHQFYTRSLFESNIDALMTTDPSGIITDVNKQMEVLTGCTRDELIGAPFKNYFTDPELAEASIKQVLIDKKVTNYELTVRAIDGKETVVSYNATTFYDRDRRLQGVFAAARDVTERKRLDQVLQEKNLELKNASLVAEKANLAKSDFLSSMSHELRSPLNAILGFAQLMESDEPPPAPAQKESIAQILQAGWHLLKLINEILDLAKVESRQVPLSEEPVSLAEVMLECQGMIEPQAQQRGITLSFPSFDVPYFVRADRVRLKQVLINLLSNAIKYNQPKGTVRVDCHIMNAENTRITVTDTGMGLSAEKITQLFQAFNRLGQEASGVEGTGIGLVVAKRLVELMGGVIGVQSTVGVGSEFWFELISVTEIELPEEAVVVALAQTPITSGAKHYTVLYVEDNPANLKLVEQIIMRHGNMSLLSAVEGNLGIELAINQSPDVILMDINLPGINGFEALKILQDNAITTAIPVIAISANAMPRDIERGLQAGFFRYITKPIKVNEFVEALNIALEFIKH